MGIAGASSMATVYGGASKITFNSDYSMGDELPTKRRKIEREKQAPSENSIGFKLPVGATGKGPAISRVRNKCKRTQLYQEAKHVAKKHASKVRRKSQGPWTTLARQMTRWSTVMMRRSQETKIWMSSPAISTQIFHRRL